MYQTNLGQLERCSLLVSPLEVNYESLKRQGINQIVFTYIQLALVELEHWFELVAVGFLAYWELGP